MSSGNTLTDSPGNNVFPANWPSLSPVKLTQKINHLRATVIDSSTLAEMERGDSPREEKQIPRHYMYCCFQLFYIKNISVNCFIYVFYTNVLLFFKGRYIDVELIDYGKLLSKNALPIYILTPYENPIFPHPHQPWMLSGFKNVAKPMNERTFDFFFF